MANIELYQFPENTNPSPVDFLYMSNTFEPGNISEKVTYPNLFSVIAKLDTNPAPAATDRLVMAPLAGDAFQFTSQELSDFFASLQPPAAIPTRDQVYTASGTGLISLVAGKPGGWTGTLAGILDPAQTFAQFQAIAAPTQGLHAYAIDIDRSVWFDGLSYQQVAWLSDIDAITTDGAIGETFFSNNATETVIAVGSTPVKVNATYVVGSNNTANMLVAAGRITNNGFDPITFSLELALSATLASTTGQINAYVYLNGVTPVPGIIMEIDVDGVTPSYHGFPVSGTVTLLAGQYIEAFVGNFTSPASTDNIIVKSLNLKITTVGAVSSVLPTGLEEAYTVGNEMIMTAARPLEFQSNDNAIIPTFNFRQLQIPVPSQIIAKHSAFSLNSLSAAKEYSRTTVTVTDATDTVEAADIDFYSRWASPIGLPNFARYAGFESATGVYNYSSPLTMGEQKRGVSSTLCTTVAPTEVYPSNSLTSIWQTLNRSPIVSPLNLPIGSTLEFRCIGKVSAALPDPIIGSDMFFNIKFGGIINLNSSNVFPVVIPVGGYEADFEWIFRIIRTDQIRLAVCGNGMFIKEDGTRTTISFPSSIWTSAYVDVSSYTLEVNLDTLGADFTGASYVRYIARGFTINQYS